MPVQVARRRANSRRGSRLGRREKRRRTVNFNAELGGRLILTVGSKLDETTLDGLHSVWVDLSPFHHQRQPIYRRSL